MVRKVKFPLEMADGVQVRNLEALKENFDVEKVIAYFLDGKLQTWLADRYYEEEAEAVAALSKDDGQIDRKLSEIFGIEYSEEDEVDIEEISWKNERLAKIKQLTDDDEIIKNADYVAFNQEELAELYDEGVERIYLCEGEFTIPKSKQDLEYIEFSGARVDGVKKAETAKPTHVYTEHALTYDMELKLSADKRLYAIDFGVKRVLAENVNSYARNSKYIFYCCNKTNSNCISDYKIFRYDPLTKEEKIIVNEEWPKDLQCNEKYLLWSSLEEIKMCDLDGDFLETIVHDNCWTSANPDFKIYNNTLYYFNEKNCNKTVSTLIAFNLDTKKAKCVSRHKDVFCIYNNKLYSCMYEAESPCHAVGAPYIKPGNYFYESDLDGGNEREIKMFKIPGGMYGFEGKCVTNIRCEDGKLYYTYNSDGHDCEECFDIPLSQVTGKEK